jgi:HD-GYP domain-containing protein (c-di-GMP phosphodiesterase class II)
MIEQGIYSDSKDEKEPNTHITIWVIEDLEANTENLARLVDVEKFAPGSVVIWDSTGPPREDQEPLLKYVADNLWKSLAPRRKALAEAEKNQQETTGKKGRPGTDVSKGGAKAEPVTPNALMKLYQVALRDLRPQLFPDVPPRKGAGKWTVVTKPLKKSMSLIMTFEGLANRSWGYFSKGHFVCSHIFKTSLLSFVLAHAKGRSQEDIQKTGLVGLFQDLGMFSTEGGLLPLTEKRGPLSQQDLRALHRHPEESLLKIDTLDLDHDIFDGVVQSHERLDGSGYPDRLAEDQICQAARITAVADTFVALTSERPYRSAASVITAASTVKQMAEGGQLDMSVVDRLFEFLSLYDEGRYVALSSNKVARVEERGENYLRPQVKVLGKGSAKQTVDLSESEEVWILRAVGPKEAKHLRDAA